MSKEYASLQEELLPLGFSRWTADPKVLARSFLTKTSSGYPFSMTGFPRKRDLLMAFSSCREFFRWAVGSVLESMSCQESATCMFQVIEKVEFADRSKYEDGRERIVFAGPLLLLFCQYYYWGKLYRISERSLSPYGIQMGPVVEDGGLVANYVLPALRCEYLDSLDVSNCDGSHSEFTMALLWRYLSVAGDGYFQQWLFRRVYCPTVVMGSDSERPKTTVEVPVARLYCKNPSGNLLTTMANSLMTYVLLRLAVPSAKLFVCGDNALAADSAPVLPRAVALFNRFGVRIRADVRAQRGHCSYGQVVCHLLGRDLVLGRDRLHICFSHVRALTSLLEYHDGETSISDYWDRIVALRALMCDSPEWTFWECLANWYCRGFAGLCTTCALQQYAYLDLLFGKMQQSTELAEIVSSWVNAKVEAQEQRTGQGAFQRCTTQSRS